jgi:uncharacterized protein
MNLNVSLSKLGHYVKNAAKAITKPINTAIALVAISTAHSFNTLQAQIRTDGDTLYGTGIFQTLNEETTNFIGNVLLSLRPESMAMITPDTTYQFITANYGGVEFELPVYIDSTTNITNINIAKDKTHILPNFGSELNAFFPKTEKGTIEMYSINGQLVKKEDFNTDHEYLQFNDLASGLYVYSIRTESGILHSGKFLKQNTPPKGPSARPNIESSNFKNTQITHTATYWAKWEHPDFYTDSTLITLEEGNNGPINFFMTSNIIPIPQHQDLIGIAKDGNNNYAPLSNITAILYNQTTNQTIEKTTNSNGQYIFEDVPTGSVCFISVGGNDNKWSFSDIPYTVPQHITTMNDTLMDKCSAVLYDKDPAIQALNILVQQTRNGTQDQIRKYWFNSTVSSSDQAIYNSYFSQLDAMGNNYTHIQTANESEAQIKIQTGAFNTGTSTTTVETPFGNLYPTYIATVSMHTGQFGSFAHEIYQADGKSQCSGNGVLSSAPPPTGPNAEDLAIAELDMNYWVYDVYTNQETYFDLNKTSIDLQSKSPQYFSKPFTESGVQVNYSGK